ncbi:MAG: DNA topoisomerase VI subunit B [archaeon]
MAEEKKVTAEELAGGLRAISVAEFFEKNRHLLGFDTLPRAMLTAVKEAVDNALDACEESKNLPEVFIQINELGATRYKIIVEDNGPGIVKDKIGPVFGKLLFGSKFVTFGGKQGRGQQGIGISAAILYSQLTTGKPARIISKTRANQPACVVELKIDIKKNEPEIVTETTIDWNKEHGTRVELELEAKYMEKKASVVEYIMETAIVNPHATIIFIGPDGQKREFKRVTDKLPYKPETVKPHPHGIELGILLRMLKETKTRALRSFLTEEFDRVGAGTADEILKTAGLDPKIAPKFLTVEQADALIKSMHGTKVSAPSSVSLSPIGSELLKKTIEAEYNLEFAYAVTRQPEVYRGHSFIIEAAVGYGGELNKEEQLKLFRFANRVPLLYQQGACGFTKAVTQVDWKSYGLNQSAGNLPTGPAIILLHIASVWVPFTSESKDSLYPYPEIVKEAKLALQECGREMQLFVGKKFKRDMAVKKKEMFTLYGKELAEALAALTEEDKDKILKAVVKAAEVMYETGQVEEAEENGSAKAPKRKVGAFKGGKDEDE